MPDEKHHHNPIRQPRRPRPGAKANEPRAGVRQEGQPARRPGPSPDDLLHRPRQNSHNEQPDIERNEMKSFEEDKKTHVGWPNEDGNWCICHDPVAIVSLVQEHALVQIFNREGNRVQCGQYPLAELSPALSDYLKGKPLTMNGK